MCSFKSQRKPSLGYMSVSTIVGGLEYKPFRTPPAGENIVSYYHPQQPRYCPCVFPIKSSRGVLLHVEIINLQFPSSSHS